MSESFQTYGMQPFARGEARPRLRPSLPRRHRSSPHRGLENEVAASKIKDAIERKYRNAIPIDVVIEVIGKLIDKVFGEVEP